MDLEAYGSKQLAGTLPPVQQSSNKQQWFVVPVPHLSMQRTHQSRQSWNALSMFSDLSKRTLSPRQPYPNLRQPTYFQNQVPPTNIGLTVQLNTFHPARPQKKVDIRIPGSYLNNRSLNSSQSARQFRQTQSVSNLGSNGNSRLSCNFCRSNKEPEHYTSTHSLRDSNGRVTCPILFRHRCELCGATGSAAHTRSYCPLASKSVQSMKTLLSTPTMSSGRRRRSNF